MMQSLATAVVVTALACPYLYTASRVVAAQTDHVSSNTTIYRVPLMCPAARGLGCGSRAKPVLLDLQKRPAVEEAWLNKTGELLAVIWKPASQASERQATLTAAIEAHAVAMSELNGDARDAALKDLHAGLGWHRGAEVDRLSGEEARVITARLLERLVTKTPSAKGKIGALAPLLTEVIRRQLISTCTSPSACRETLLTAARTRLTKTELAALQDAIDLGFAPVGGER
jgi:hypothetical protein